MALTRRDCPAFDQHGNRLPPSTATMDMNVPMQQSKYYVEIIKLVTDEVVKRMGPHDERKAEQVERGVSINLNHEEYYTRL